MEPNRPKSRVKFGLSSKERIKFLLSYNPLTGIFIWKHDGGGNRKRHFAGERAGIINNSYRKISIDGVYYEEHLLAFVFMTGDWPKLLEVDHRNEDKEDNKWLNLREVTSAQNKWNVTYKKKTNKYGFLGVTKSKDRERYFAKITDEKGERIHLGSFPTAELAGIAYQQAKLLRNERGGLQND